MIEAKTSKCGGLYWRQNSLNMVVFNCMCMICLIADYFPILGLYMGDSILNDHFCVQRTFVNDFFKYKYCICNLTHRVQKMCLEHQKHVDHGHITQLVI